MEMWAMGRQKSLHTQTRIMLYKPYIVQVKNTHNFSQYALEKLALILYL